MWQCTPYNCGAASIWALSYTYDTAGNVQQWTHPAGFTITNTYNAALQLTNVTSSLNDTTHPPALATLAYAPSGALHTLLNGCVPSGSCTQAQETYDYNKRLQPVRLQLGTSSNNYANYCLVYNYYAGVANPSTCTSTPTQAASGNNGNTMGYWYQDNANASLSHTAAYSYDSLNRLGSAAATGAASYNQSYNYTSDTSNGRYGNMACSPGSTPQCAQPSFDSLTNRIFQINGVMASYDLAGNLTGDGSNSYQWDGERRAKSVGGGARRPSPTTPWDG